MNERMLAAFDRFLEESNKPAARKAIAVEAAVNRFERRLARVFKKQKGIALSKLGWLKKFTVLQESTAPQPWDNSAQSWWDQVGSATDAIIEAALIDAATVGLDAGGAEMLRQAEIGLKFDLDNPAAVKWIEDRGAELVAGLSETSIETMRRIIARGIADGADYNAIAKEIGLAFDGFSRDRSKLVAVTEMGNAFEAGAELAAQELQDAGAEMEKSWLTAGDAKVEPECLGNAADGWIPLDDDFSSGDSRPLAHPNCRCTALYRVASAARRAA